MSFYATIRPSAIVAEVGAAQAGALAAEALTEGEETGVFNVVAGLNNEPGAVVSLNARSEDAARQALQRIIFVKSGLVRADMFETAGTSDVVETADNDRGSAEPGDSAGQWLDLPQPYRHAAL